MARSDLPALPPDLSSSRMTWLLVSGITASGHIFWMLTGTVRCPLAGTGLRLIMTTPPNRPTPGRRRTAVVLGVAEPAAAASSSTTVHPRVPLQHRRRAGRRQRPLDRRGHRGRLARTRRDQHQVLGPADRAQPLGDHPVGHRRQRTEEPGVVPPGPLGQHGHPGRRAQRGAGLVEPDVAVAADAQQLHRHRPGRRPARARTPRRPPPGPGGVPSGPCTAAGSMSRWSVSSRRIT